MCVAGTDGYLKRINPSFKEVLGWGENTLLTTPFFEFVHPDDVENSQRQMAELLDGGLTGTFMYRFRCSSGTLKYLQWVTTLEKATDSIFAIARDVSPEKEKERQPKLSENRFRVFF